MTNYSNDGCNRLPVVPQYLPTSLIIIRRDIFGSQLVLGSCLIIIWLFRDESLSLEKHLPPRIIPNPRN